MKIKTSAVKTAGQNNNDEMSIPTVEDTIDFIRAAHAGQVDKGGVEYWKHPVSVMIRLGPDAPTNYKLAALLHDVIEDTEHTAGDLLARGYPSEVVDAVIRLSKPRNKPYLACIEDIARSSDQIAIAVKIADNQDNLDPHRLAMLSADMLDGNDKYRKSIEILRRAQFDAHSH